MPTPSLSRCCGRSSGGFHRSLTAPWTKLTPLFRLTFVDLWGPASPDGASIVFSATMSRHSSQVATATLTADPPAGASALVIVNAKGQATSWSAVVPGRVQTPYAHQDCAMLPNGSSAPVVGEKVTMFWVMTDGRSSAPSKAIKVTGKFEKPNPY